MRLSIRTTIFAAIVAVSLSFIFLSILILNLFASSIAENEITTTLNQGRRAYERSVALRSSFVAAQARSLVQVPHHRAVMNVDDVYAETVQLTEGELNAAAGVDLMLVVDRHGQLMADVHGTI